MPRRKTPKKRSRSRSKSRKGAARRKRKLTRRHKTDAMTHAKRRHARSRSHAHKARMVHEVQSVNALLTQLLQTASSTEAQPYHFDKRHFTKDPEYRWETQERRQFKQRFPAPDVSMLRPQSDDLPPHWGNYPLKAVAHRR